MRVTVTMEPQTWRDFLELEPLAVLQQRSKGCSFTTALPSVAWFHFIWNKLNSQGSTQGKYLETAKTGRGAVIFHERCSESGFGDVV